MAKVEHRGGKNLRSRLIYVLTRLFAYPTLRLWPLKGPLALAVPLVDVFCRLIPRPRYVTIERIATPAVRGELMRAKASEPGKGALMYLHGGAFLFCGLASHRRVAARLARLTGLTVLSVDYRHLPKAVLADSLADCLAAYEWLLAEGVESVVLSGDSAGGHLAFATALGAVRAGLPVPAGIAAISPWIDFDDTERLAHPNRSRDPFIPAARLPALTALCLPGEVPIDPLRSPINGALAELPPCLILACATEVLRSDAERMADRLAVAGVPTELQIWDGQVHAFPVLAGFMPQSAQAVDEIAAFTREMVAGTASRSVA
ncbi:alpha/beta hydrolase [Alloactinosynnema sp. L-07]|uniref:alpha/beta hydrolase n=1 Tax=Alloactinosynnema sp. L-07 TaxID=1653480 RepID=UPI0006B509FE|nr:alpha/beta hydrolase [Alloactinosynnema sp. L-07]